MASLQRNCREINAAQDRARDVPNDLEQEVEPGTLKWQLDRTGR
jgi:hypothetical protein